MLNLKTKLIAAAGMAIAASRAQAQDFDLSGATDAGQSLLEQLRDNTLALTIVTLILVFIGYMALFTGRPNWYWVGMVFVALFFIYGGDNVAQSIIDFMRGATA